jgi:predicted ATP-dependent endonuclease of OLD family
MRLKNVSVREFKSIWDSGPIEVGDITCLVGKNEAGKTAILKALYRLNPLVETDAKFDVTEDYPRAYLKDYSRNRKAGAKPAVVVEADFELDQPERDAIEKEFGKGVVPNVPEVSVSRGYDNNLVHRVVVHEPAAYYIW